MKNSWIKWRRFWMDRPFTDRERMKPTSCGNSAPEDFRCRRRGGEVSCCPSKPMNVPTSSASTSASGLVSFMSFKFLLNFKFNFFAFFFENWIGDGRVNEQPQLAAMHTVWAREHNRIVEQLAGINPGWDDERLFQEARRIVGAEMQHITFKEFLPILLGTSLNAFQKEKNYLFIY